MSRTIFFVSDGTGLTAEALGHSLLTQFETHEFDYVTIPYVNDLKKAQEVIARVNTSFSRDGVRPILFATLVNREISELFKTTNALFIDFFQTFLSPLETELRTKSSQTIGSFHSAKNYDSYMLRIDAVNYVLACDDGSNTKDYEHADIILVGVSRCGKTPTSIYLALQFGIFAANYPLTEEDLSSTHLPEALRKYQQKLFGLTINTERLQKIRQERLPNSKYASYEQCQSEIEKIELLFKRVRIPFLDTTTRSIEELAADILASTNIKGKLYTHSNRIL